MLHIHSVYLGGGGGYTHAHSVYLAKKPSNCMGLQTARFKIAHLHNNVYYISIENSIRA